MKEILSTITTKGQVTLPIEIRRLLDVRPHDKVAFIVDDGEIRVKACRSVVERTAGVFKSGLPPLSAKQERAAAEEAIAEEAVKRMGG